MKTNTKHLKFFGIGKILPFLKHVRWMILTMVALALVSSLVDITIPQFQRYALDTFVGKGTMNTLFPFILAYVGMLLLAALVNYISCTQATIV
jgi:ATP-binding cassette subfamily B protein